MRDLATVAGADPAAFTRLAKALGYSGWDELRAALTEARRPAQASPFSARARGRRQGPNAEMSLVSDKLGAEAAGLSRISPGSVAGAAKALHAARRIWISGFRSCRSVAELLNYQLRLFRPDTVQLVGGSGPEDLDLGAFRSGDAVVVIGFAPYSTASVLSARAAHLSRATLIAITDGPAAPVAEGAGRAAVRGGVVSGFPSRPARSPSAIAGRGRSCWAAACRQLEKRRASRHLTMLPERRHDRSNQPRYTGGCMKTTGPLAAMAWLMPRTATDPRCVGGAALYPATSIRAIGPSPGGRQNSPTRPYRFFS